jgi:hypothetical protein
MAGISFCLFEHFLANTFVYFILTTTYEQENQMHFRLFLPNFLFVLLVTVKIVFLLFGNFKFLVFFTLFEKFISKQ